MKPAAYARWADVPAPARALLGDDARLHYACVAATFSSRGRFLKVQPAGTFPALSDEAARTAWVGRTLSVPALVDVGSADGAEWMCTEAVRGQDATAFVDDPEWIVPIFARGLRRLHDALSVRDCPFSFRHDVALAHVAARLDDIDPRGWHEVHQHLSVREAFRELREHAPVEDDLVVCHGDYCFPNVLVEDGEVRCWLDLGELGVASRWLDLAVATWTCTWNVGPGYEALFLREYGATLNERSCAWFRLLYDMAS